MSFEATLINFTLFKSPDLQEFNSVNHLNILISQLYQFILLMQMHSQQNVNFLPLLHRLLLFSVVNGDTGLFGPHD